MGTRRSEYVAIQKGAEIRGIDGNALEMQDIMDERYVAIDVLGKGLVILSA
jgi:hypothetical protein